MKAIKSERGFINVHHPAYTEPERNKRIIGESSAIGEYEDSMEKPGSSFLWVGEHHHLNREEVQELINKMQHWLDTGRLAND